MLLKVFGHGFYGYIQDGFNVFDGFIVLLRYQIITLLFISFFSLILRSSSLFVFNSTFCYFTFIVAK